MCQITGNLPLVVHSVDDFEKSPTHGDAHPFSDTPFMLNKKTCNSINYICIYLNIQGSTQAAINNEIATLVAKAAGKFFSFILSIKLKEWF